MILGQSKNGRAWYYEQHTGVDCCRSREGPERSLRGVNLGAAGVSKDCIVDQSTAEQAKLALDYKFSAVRVGRLRHEQADDCLDTGYVVEKGGGTVTVAMVTARLSTALSLASFERSQWRKRRWLWDR